MLTRIGVHGAPRVDGADWPGVPRAVIHNSKLLATPDSLQAGLRLPAGVQGKGPLFSPP